MDDDAQTGPTLGPKAEKLVEAKRGWARDGRLLTGTTAAPEMRLPPGQRLTKDWPVLDLGTQPDVTAARFRLDAGALEDASGVRVDLLLRKSEESGGASGASSAERDRNERHDCGSEPAGRPCRRAGRE